MRRASASCFLRQKPEEYREVRKLRGLACHALRWNPSGRELVTAAEEEFAASADAHGSVTKGIEQLWSARHAFD